MAVWGSLGHRHVLGQAVVAENAAVHHSVRYSATLIYVRILLHIHQDVLPSDVQALVVFQPHLVNAV